MNPTLTFALLASLFGLSQSVRANLFVLHREHQPTSLSSPTTDTDRERDGLVGPVRRVKTEMVKLSNKGGKVTEGARVVIESVAYDIKGTKIENSYFPIPGAALTGKEVYKYDDKGNIVEMSLYNGDGSLLSKEVYSYEFDAFGNWTKMTTSVALIEGGKVSYEPTEVTYRTISYYLDEATLAKMNQVTTPTPPQSSAGAAPNVVAAKAGVTPMPSGASLVKTNVATAPSGLNISANTASKNQTVKVDEEPPPAMPAARAPKPMLRPVSGGVLNGKAISLPKPSYPLSARNAHISGTVTVEVVIDESGKVISAKAVDGHQFLRDAAEQAAKGARFSPTVLSGQPMKVSGQITYNFALQQ
ncbi:MAG: energy transducer TonB, partial [Acidobacteriota bacterium]|nr:energy transducer TonB [Acidobacteriota bacterium]